MKRRIVATGVAALAATGLTAMATPTAAVASRPGPRPVTTWVDAVPAGQTSWVSVNWTTGRKICDAKVTVEGGDVRIGYPENTGTYTSFWQSDRLRPKRLDYTAFTVHPEGPADRYRQLHATLRYTTCGRHAVEKAQTYRLTLVVLPADPAEK
ncbi:hypothetical protein GCM10020358_58520 [Amorphoplanes nipponensis]|uniref:Uncharacterized protein n=2 Tax=Actinoplanes nipponensis TaxID=135950 RepID=A0A919JT93_9ACTN|nr:hypothetical protein Ani05nite_60880 [Actinoplanes nipponensis]